ncbi:MAG: alpha-amylase family glycosyl hydrolase [Verrucomicrobiota bacterium]|nr:alpha-amylase family glycosyl hydrolase [Verrucomicrobiota bacterium]
MREEIIAASDSVVLRLVVSASTLSIGYRSPQAVGDPLTLFVAIGTHSQMGAAVLPFAQHAEGSTVFLPFKSDLLLMAEMRGGQMVCFLRRWERWRWSEREETSAFALTGENGEFVFRVPRALLGEIRQVDCAIYAKDPSANGGWGWFWGCADRGVPSGVGDKYISRFYQLDLVSTSGPIITEQTRQNSDKARIRVYQLFVRLFGNTNETRKQNGTLAENGVGRFADISEAAISSIQKMGFTHIWLTGVLQQATATDYSEAGQPPDDSDLLKGLAGSPYAIKDYFDVCPDYAQEPANRLREFEALIARLHAHDLKAIIDLVPNHVARSCDSCVRPDSNFGRCGGDGAGDDVKKFFDPRNNFFYLTPDGNGPPLRLPTCKDGVPVSPTCQIPGANCDGLFEGEKSFGRVTGNNVVSWTPGLSDWYETVKLNYGFDFTDPVKSVREYPNAWAPEKPIPDTWRKMDQVIAHWQALGVDGFRCDMSHMVPPEFWSWAIAQARARQPDVFFMGEAYDDDPSKVPGSDPVISALNWGKGNVLFDLLNAGFDAVYDAPVYRALKRIFDGSGWANDIDREITEAFLCHNSVRYAENHDEVRLAARSEWAGVGMEVGRPVSAILYGMSRGAVMLYNGQEVGELGAGAEGFASDDARTTIFDYWSMPEMVKWVNEHRYDGGHLSVEQKALRAFYGRLITLVGEPAFKDGNFFPLNAANHDNQAFGRLPGEPASGHWLYAFLRYDVVTQQRFLVVANLHATIPLQDVRIVLPLSALEFLDLDEIASTKLKLIDRLSEDGFETDLTNTDAKTFEVPIAEIPPLSAFYLELL